MKTEIRNSTSGLLFIPLVVACFALLPSVRATPDPAAVPPGNTADGQGALASLTTGVGNTGFGLLAGGSITIGNNNNAQGNASLQNLTTGSGNAGIGAQAGQNLTTGIHNVAVGNTALRGLTTGSRNTGVGYGTLRSGNFSDNTAVGWSAMISNTTGTNNTAIGVQALASNTTGNGNTANGANALVNNTEGFNNTANGIGALANNINQDGNTAIGRAALINTNAGFNTAVGNGALQNNMSGIGNTALGDLAGNNVTTADDVICIGAGVSGENTDNRTYIGNIGTFTQAFSAGVNELVTVNLATGRLGHFNPVSSRRYKEDIKPLDKTSEALFSLQPVSYRLKEEFDPTQALAFGLIAEEVEKVNPDLVSRNNKGQVESVRYEMVNAMMLNEFLKEHRKVEQLTKDFESKLAEQQKQIEALSAGLQKVSAQLQASKPAPRTVLNNQ